MRRRAGLALAAGAAVLALLAGCSAPDVVDIDVPPQVEGELPADTVAQLQGAVEHAMAATGSSGAIVGVWAPWSGSWVAGLGTQEHGGGAPVETDMVFRAADVTRAMTCDVLFQVAEEGLVGLDDSVTEWVNGFPDLDDVTLAQLCDSTSGVASYEPQLRAAWFNNPTRPWDPRELAGYGLGPERTDEPGAVFRDSDAGYLLLGLALERATQKNLSALVAEYVADPLALDATALPGPRASVPAGDSALHGYWSVPDAEGVWNCTDPVEFTDASASIGGAAAGAVTDITDLGRYAQALASGALVPDDADRFGTPLPVAADQPTWYTTTGGAFQAGSLIGQYGDVPGYLTAAFADPTTGLTIAVVLNNSGADPSIGSYLAWELAALASRAPAADGQSIPEAGLPWTAQQYHDQIAQKAICAVPAP